MMMMFRWQAEDGSFCTLQLDDCDFRIGVGHPVARNPFFEDLVNRHGVFLNRSCEIVFGFTHMIVVEYHSTEEYRKPHLSHECRGGIGIEGENICLEVRVVPYLPGILQ